MWRGESPARVWLPHGLLLGGSPSIRQLPRHSRSLYVPRKEGGKGGRRPGRTSTGDEGDDDLPALPSTRLGPEVGVSGKGRRAGPELSHSALRRQWEDEQHFVALASARQSARRA